MNCKSLNENLYEYLDGELSPLESAAVREHLERCSICRQAFQHEMDSGRFLSSHLERAVETVRLEPRLRQQIAQAIEKNTAPPRRTFVSRPWMRLALPLAAAAAIVVAIICLKHGFHPSDSSTPHVPQVSTTPNSKEVLVHVSYCVPSYTFRRDGNTVVDTFDCEPRVAEGAMISKN